MSLKDDLGIDLNAIDPDQLERDLSGPPPLIPEGVYHAILDGVGTIPNADDRGWKLVFVVQGGPHHGTKIEEILWKPKGEDAKKDATTKNRILLFMHRLGAIQRVTKADGKPGFVETPGKYGLQDCLGTPCVIDIQHDTREYKKDGVVQMGKDGKPRTITEAKLKFNGLLDPASDAAKAANGAAVEGPAAGTAAGPRKYDEL